MTFLEAYEQAAVAICKAIQYEADTRKANGAKPWSALLEPTEFHDRCYRLARAAMWRQVEQ